MNCEDMLVNKFKGGNITLGAFVDSVCEVSDYYDNELIEYYTEEESYEDFISRLEAARV